MISIARTFGAPERAGGKGETQHVDRRTAFSGAPLTCDVVHNVAVLFQRHHLVDLGEPN